MLRQTISSTAQTQRRIDPPQLKQHQTPASRLTPAGAWQHHQVSHSNVKRKKLVERAPYFPPRRHPAFFTYLYKQPSNRCPREIEFPTIIVDTDWCRCQSWPDMGSTGHDTTKRKEKRKNRQTDVLSYCIIHLHLGYSVSRILVSSRVVHQVRTSWLLCTERN